MSLEACPNCQLPEVYGAGNQATSQQCETRQVIQYLRRLL
jgi:hypothetical protein